MPRKAIHPKIASNCPLTGSAELRSAANAQTASIQDNFPNGIGQPALRALYGAGYTHLEQLANVRERELLKLHGIGPKAVRVIRQALQEQGLDYRR